VGLEGRAEGLAEGLEGRQVGATLCTKGMTGEGPRGTATSEGRGEGPPEGQGLVPPPPLGMGPEEDTGPGEGRVEGLRGAEEADRPCEE